MEELTAQRTAALRVEVMRRPDLTLIGGVHAMALPVVYAHAYEVGSCFDVRVLLVDCASLAVQVGDWEGRPDHASYLARLRRAHPRKAALWKQAAS